MAAPLTVLESFPAPRASSVNPYTTLLAEGLRAAGVTVLTFSWRTALLARYDLLHVHWPEILVTGRTPFRQLVRQTLTLLLVVRLSLTRRPIVRTMHNLGLPEGLSPIQRRLLRAIDHRTVLRIRLNDYTPIAAAVDCVTIPHGHFRDWFSAITPSPTVPGRIGYIGRIRRYKGVESLIAAFTAVDQVVMADAAAPGQAPTPLSLRIAGYPSTAELAQALTRAVAGDDRVSLEFGFISDETLVDVVTSSELVVLPYRLMHNSAAVLTALSLGRPVLVPDNLVTEALAHEVGRGWVHSFEGELTAAAILSTIAELRAAPPAGAPELAARGWAHSAQAHVSAFRRALRGAGRR